MLSLLRPLPLLLATSAWAQNPLYVSAGATAHELLGWSLAPHADVDGDGIRENLAFRARGAVLLRGSDGAVLREHQRGQLSLGDLDGDDWSELAAAGPESPWFVDGSIDVISGASGAVIANWNWSQAPNAPTRYEPIPLGDVNGDGVGDVLAPGWWNVAGPGSGPVILVLSGVDGSELRRHSGWYSASSMGDLNGDGRPDYYLDGYGWPSPPRLISGADGAVLATHPDPFGGTIVAPTDDLNGDGVPEIVRFGAYTVRFFIFSGANGALLHVVDGYPARSQQYFTPNALNWPDGGSGPKVLSADVNGDGVREIGVYDPLTSSTTLRSLATGATVARYDTLGFAALNAGDVNGDGRDDVLFGTPYSAQARGRVLLATAPYDARVGVGFAFSSSSCACGPSTNPETGCPNEFFQSGVALTAWGSASLAGRDLQFFMAGYSIDSWFGPATTFLLYSPNALPTPLASGAGLLAIAPPHARIARIANGPIRSIDAPELDAWSGFTAGQVGYFQVWSRKMVSWPTLCPHRYTLSNAVAITFTP